ncbi:MAG: GNAT family N-acetyltransferase [Chitinophagaceae bacterium]|nr:GNAT family N-acetyltransferase [Chitinophagaceae bacterium]
MISVIRATEKDFQPIVNIGRVAVTEAHRESTTAENMKAYIDSNYSDSAIKEELKDPGNIYHIVHYNGKPVGFSKIILNAAHPDIEAENVTKLDRIYILAAYHNLKLGLELLQFNIRLAENNNQSGLWLYTWIGNTRAINFYLKTGFKIIGSHKFYVTETFYNLNHHMLLSLVEI